MINDHRDQGDLHEPSDCDHEHNDARSPRQKAALLEVCESRHLADDDNLDDNDNDAKGRGEAEKGDDYDKSTLTHIKLTAVFCLYI